MNDWHTACACTIEPIAANSFGLSGREKSYFKAWADSSAPLHTKWPRSDDSFKKIDSHHIPAVTTLENFNEENLTKGKNQAFWAIRAARAQLKAEILAMMGKKEFDRPGYHLFHERYFSYGFVPISLF